VGRKAGVTDEKLIALADYESSPDLTDLEKLAIRYAAEMTRAPVEVPDELFSELRKHFNDQQIVELTSAIAWENYRARNNHALGLESEGFSKGAFCPMPPNPWTGSATAVAGVAGAAGAISEKILQKQYEKLDCDRILNTDSPESCFSWIEPIVDKGVGLS
jgi:hypothetical protein